MHISLSFIRHSDSLLRLVICVIALYAPMSASYPPLSAAHWFAEDLSSDKGKVFFLQMPSHFPIKPPPKSNIETKSPIPPSPSPPPSASPPPTASPPSKKTDTKANLTAALAKKRGQTVSPSPEAAAAPVIVSAKKQDFEKVPDEEGMDDFLHNCCVIRCFANHSFVWFIKKYWILGYWLWKRKMLARYNALLSLISLLFLVAYLII
jgi:hypothetical protein